MGDRDRERPAHNGSVTSLVMGNVLLEEERSLLGEGLTHGELRDEIYCQVMKQLTGNPNPYVLEFCILGKYALFNFVCRESIFKGWQLLCVLLVTFPPLQELRAIAAKFLASSDLSARRTYRCHGEVLLATSCICVEEGPSRKGPYTFGDRSRIRE